MARSLKVYGWLGSFPRNFPVPDDKRHRVQARSVVAARSLAEFMRITGVKRSFLPYVGETGNEKEVAAAMSKPGTIFFMDDVNYVPRDAVMLEWPEGGVWREED